MWKNNLIKNLFLKDTSSQLLFVALIVLSSLVLSSIFYNYSVFFHNTSKETEYKIFQEKIVRGDSVITKNNDIINAIISLKNENLVQADLISHFNNLKTDYDKSKNELLLVYGNEAINHIVVADSLINSIILLIQSKFYNPTDTLVYYNFYQAYYNYSVSLSNIILASNKRFISSLNNNEYVDNKTDSIFFIINSAILFFIVLVFIVYFYNHKKIQKKADKLFLLLKNLPTPLLLISGNGIIVYLNNSFEELVSESKDSIVGKNLFDMFSIAPANAQHNNEVINIDNILSSNDWSGDVYCRCNNKNIEVFINLIKLDCFNKDFFIVFCVNNSVQKNNEQQLATLKEQYRSLIDSSVDGNIIIQDGELVYVNPSAVQMFGYYSLEEFKSADFYIKILNNINSKLKSTGGILNAGFFLMRNFELQCQSKDGKFLDLDVSAHIVKWNLNDAIKVVFRNITEIKFLERERALWLWEQEILSDIDKKLAGLIDLEKIFDAILKQTINLTRAHFGGVLLLDDSEKYVKWEAIFGNNFKHDLDNIVDKEIINVIINKKDRLILHKNDDDDSESKKLLDLKLIKEEQLFSTVWMPLMIEGVQKGMLVVGYRCYHEFTLREMRLLHSLVEKHTIAMVNAQLYAKLVKREKDLEVLSGARVQAQEDERRRIAKEIHDGLGQMLTAIKFNLEVLQDTISVGKDEQNRIDDMKNLLDNVMKEAREISYNLMPSVLDDFGLVPALQLLSQQFMNRTNIIVKFQAHGINERLKPSLEISLYRIAQEALNNISKHAEASEVNLQLIRHSEYIRLIVEDNGKGFVPNDDYTKNIGKGGMGLVSMKERASTFGGILTIDSTPNNGTLVTVEIPINKI